MVVPLIFIPLYYVGGMTWMHRIDDDPGFAEGLDVAAGSSRAVAAAAGLVEREVVTHRWLANDPIFLPSHFLDNAPNFQQGIIAALGRFAVELSDELGRVRGTSGIDPDVSAAAGRLQYPGDVWIFEWSSAPVQPSSESQYRRAAEDLRRYNDRLARGEAVFDKRTDNLLATLDRIALDIGAMSATDAQKIERDSRSWVDFSADDLFYRNKGRLYAYYIILRELGRDFEDVIRSSNMEAVWAELMFSLRAAATLHPWVVLNGPLESLAVPNHLSAQGFLLLRARVQLREITSILST